MTERTDTSRTLQREALNSPHEVKQTNKLSSIYDVTYTLKPMYRKMREGGQKIV